METEGLEDELDGLAGGSFLADVRAAHEVFGEALGIGDNTPDEAPSLLEAVTALRHSISDYARMLAGEVDSADAESVARFHAAMKPRDVHMARRRSAPAGGGVDDDGEDEGEGEGVLDTELPDLPPLLDEVG